MTSTAPYPFSALVASGDLELALVLNAVHPAIGGVLVRGEKGTAKSTAVRGLAALLPEVEVVPGCRFACDPAGPEPGCPDGPHGDPYRDWRAERRPARRVRRTMVAWSQRSFISERGAGSCATSSTVIVSVTASSAMRATSGASTKRIPCRVSTTRPSKMFSRVLSSTRRTFPTSTPSEARTGVPRRSAL